MRRTVGIGAAWLGATLVAVTVAAAAVGSVRSEVADVPTALGAPTISVASTTVPTDLPGSVTTPSLVSATTTTTVETAEPEETTTTVAADTSGESPVTTTAPPVTSTTTTVSSYTKTYGAEAGLPGEVTIVVSGESVTFGGASSLPGWKVELKNSGPEEVKVQFERNEDEDEEEEIEFRATVEDGELKIMISEES